MSRKNTRMPVISAIIALVLLVAVFALRGWLSRPVRVVLPEESSAEDNEAGQSGESASAIAYIEVTPSTVQSAIATLTRPEQYSCSFLVERSCGDKSAAETGTLCVFEPWSRMDITGGGEARHVLTDGETVYIWYGSSKRVYSSAAAFTADEEQGVPTYESVLALDTDRIALADYRLLDGTDCIYVETAEDEAGYVERYWVSVGAGLLVSAEKLCGGETIYRYTSGELNASEITQERFTLPDGTVLCSTEK